MYISIFHLEIVFNSNIFQILPHGLMLQIGAVLFFATAHYEHRHFSNLLIDYFANLSKLKAILPFAVIKSM